MRNIFFVFVACGGTFSAPTGTLVSPYWPARYPHGKTCNYLLSARADQVIEVTFTNFGVEAANSADQACTYDNLAVSRLERFRYKDYNGFSYSVETHCNKSA